MGKAKTGSKKGSNGSKSKTTKRSKPSSNGTADRPTQAWESGKSVKCAPDESEKS